MPHLRRRNARHHTGTSGHRILECVPQSYKKSYSTDRQQTHVDDNSHYLILNGMMMSPANVNCELFVPPPNGVVLFKDVS